MSITTTVQQFDTARIPTEGSTTFRADASYVWGFIPYVIDGINGVSSEMNTLANVVNTQYLSVNTNTALVVGYRDTTKVYMDASLEAKSGAETAMQHTQDIADGIDGAISDAVNAQFGEYTSQIAKNSRKLKMKNFGLTL